MTSSQELPWIAAHASVRGKGHVESGLPCQDDHNWAPLPEHPSWGVAVVSDGAGSAANSDRGSKRVVETATAMFTALLREQQWANGQSLPEAEAWTTMARRTLRAIADDLTVFSEQETLPLRSLSATLIVVIFGPTGLLATHVGDGRAAGRRYSDGGWQPLIEPYHGEEANVTVFLTSDIWESDAMGTYVGASVFPEPFDAFALLSDGCEMATFSLSRLNEETGLKQETNQPHPPFFNPNVEALRAMHAQGLSAPEINGLWHSLLHDGVPRLAHESDDKTMIVAVRPMASSEALDMNAPNQQEAPRMVASESIGKELDGIEGLEVATSWQPSPDAGTTTNHSPTGNSLLVAGLLAATGLLFTVIASLISSVSSRPGADSRKVL